MSSSVEVVFKVITDCFQFLDLTFEKKNISGGLCRSWKWRDFIVDTGPHIFHTPDKNLAAF